MLTKTAHNDVEHIDLNPYQQRLLWNNMFMSWFEKERGDAKTALLVLHVIAATGNNAMLKEIESVARKNSSEWRCKHVVRVAKACASNMKQRLAQQNVPETLLRPSLLSTSPDLLLRPVTSSTQPSLNDAEQLLRPTTEEDQDEVVQTRQSGLPLTEQTIVKEAKQPLRLGLIQEQSYPE